MENDLGTKTISEALFIFEFNNLLYKDIQRRLKWMQTKQYRLAPTHKQDNQMHNQD